MRGSIVRSCLPAVVVTIVGGCTPVHLAVRPVTPTRAIGAEQVCSEGPDLLGCLTKGQPTHRLHLAGGDRVQWIKTSDGGEDLVLSVKTKPPGVQMEVSQLVAVDVGGGREKWRVQLDDEGVLAARDAYFFDPDQVVLSTAPHAAVPSTLVSLSRRDGHVLWRYPAARLTTTTTGSTMTTNEEPTSDVPVSVIIQDREHGFLVVEEGKNLSIVDGTGHAIATMARLDDPDRAFGAQAFVAGDDIYVVDLGLVRIDRQARKFSWASKFVTYTHDPHNGSNAGRIVGSILLSVLTAPFAQTVNLGSVPPDYLVGLVTEPVTSGRAVCMGAISTINCFDRQTGGLLWSRRFGVLQFQTLAAGTDRLFAVTGGRHVHIRGRAPVEVTEIKTAGLYALRLADGDRVPEFASPFGANARGAPVPAAVLRAEDPAQAADAAGKLTGASVGIASPLFAVRPTSAGLLIVGLNKAGVLDPTRGALLGQVDLGTIGPVVAAIPCGTDRLLVRGARGLAAFDERSGSLLWTTSLPPAPSLEKLGDPGNQRMLNVPSELAASVEFGHFKSNVFWPLPEENLVLVPAGAQAGTSVAAVRLSDGIVLGYLPLGGRVSVLSGKRAQFVAIAAPERVDLFRLPHLSPASAPVSTSGDAAPMTPAAPASDDGTNAAGETAAP